MQIYVKHVLANNSVSVCQNKHARFFVSVM
jgi:hypothetical protein